MSDLPPVKGKRPVFARDPMNDRLVAIVMAVAQELAVLRERCDTYERVLTEKGIWRESDLEDYSPPAAVEAAREQWRQDYLDRILWIMQQPPEATA